MKGEMWVRMGRVSVVSQAGDLNVCEDRRIFRAGAASFLLLFFLRAEGSSLWRSIAKFETTFLTLNGRPSPGQVESHMTEPVRRYN
jgi:hypothetical protein